MTKIEKGKREIRVDRMGTAFAKTMTIFTIIGIIVMVIPAISYFSGVNQYVPLMEAHKYWNMSATKFWEHVTPNHQPVKGYSWIFNNLDKTDCQSMIGVLILMITPLLSMIAACARAENKTYRALFLLAALEFIASIVVKSLLSSMGAKKVASKVSSKVSGKIKK